MLCLKINIMSKIKATLSFKLAFIMMFTSLFGIAILTYVSFIQSKKIFTENSIELLDRNLDKHETSIQDSLNTLKYDITMLLTIPQCKDF